MKLARFLLLLVGALLLPGGACWSQDYPDRPIKLVVPFAPGGGTDVIGRLWAEAMRLPLGSMFLENQAGAGGTLAAAAVARARPDGYTLLLSTGGPLFVAGGNLSYDAAKDLVPVTVLGTTALAIVVHPSVPARDLKELVEYAKTNPGKLSYGSAGFGTMSHLAGALFNSLTGADIVHVAYKGGGQFVSDLLGGNLNMGMMNLTETVVHLHRTDKLRMLATMGHARHAAMPDVPTAAEQGFSGLIARNFFGVFAPSATPKAILARISDATRAAMADGLREKLLAAGYEPYPDLASEAARRFVRDGADRWTPMIKAIGSKPESED